MTAQKPSEQKSPTPSKLIPLALAGSAILALGAGGLFYYATQTSTGPEKGTVYKVVVGDKSCDPMDFTIPAGRSTFEIHNASKRPIEWEILDGIMVVEERENIAPGFHSLLTARLKPGSYEITCGLLSNPRGKLVATPTAQSDAERTAPPIKAFIGPLSEYKVFLTIQSSNLIKNTQQLAAAIRAGDLEQAKALYLEARLPYKRIEAVTGRMADIENAIDPLADYLEKREQDPAFTGFHRIEYGLFSQNTLDGLQPVADQLAETIISLKERLRALKLAPDDLAANAERLARHLGEGQVEAGENRYAFNDLAELEASVDGMEKSVGLLEPLAKDASPQVAQKINDAFAAIRTQLVQLKTPQGYPPYQTIDPAQRKQLADMFKKLADAIASLNPAIGLG